MIEKIENSTTKNRKNFVPDSTKFELHPKKKERVGVDFGVRNRKKIAKSKD